LALGSAGCLPSVGDCDQEAALEVVYTADGTPAFAGQAVLFTSCGAGGFCHATDSIDAQDRFGAPVSLGFDVGIASAGAAPNEEQAERLRRHVQTVLDQRSNILDQVRSGSMPPEGGAGETYRTQVAGPEFTYDRFEDDGVTFAPLPSLYDEDEARRDEAEEILRNWLACRTPVIERTEMRDDRLDNVIGFTVAACNRTCTDVTWEAIYGEVLAPTCATSRCHDETDPAAELDFVTGGADGLFQRLVVDGQTAVGTQCAAEGQSLVIASEPDMSLLLLKLEAASSDDVCGSRMPLSGSPLNSQRLCAIREWIACGACNAGDDSCDDCLEMARTTCRIDLSAESNCSESDPCVNRVTL